MSEPGRGPQRRAELAAALDRVRARVAAAEQAAGRRAGSVTLVVVTKTFPASDVVLLADLGVREVGESREPEAGEKARACAGLPLRWHQVGQVQTRRAGAVAAWADVVHSVDRPRLVAALSRAVEGRGAPLACLVQVSLDPEAAGDPGRDPGVGPGRGGAPPSAVSALADQVAGAPGLELAGVMGLAPLGEDPSPAFARLQEVAERVLADHPGAGVVSAGMSGDLEAAVAHGATVVRVGSAILGTRPRGD